MGPSLITSKTIYKYTLPKKRVNKTILTITTLIGTIMGAGFLGIPYVASQPGIKIALIELVLIGALMTFVMLGLGEVILRTKEKHQLAGYAERYLGSAGKKMMVASMVIGIYAALLAYLIAESQSLSFIITGTFNQSIRWGIAFWALVAIITYGGLKSVKKAEFIGVALVLATLGIITIIAFPEIKVENVTYTNMSNWAAPLGVIIFSLLGYSALPEARELQGPHARTLKTSIILAYLIVIVAYSIFTALIIGALGTKIPEVATLTFGRRFAVMGVITMLTAYLALATALIDMLRYDYGWHRKQAWALTSSVPLALFALVSLTNLASFTFILEIGGLVSGGLTLIMIVMMVKKAKERGNRKPEYQLPNIPGLGILFTLVFLAITFIELVALAT